MAAGAEDLEDRIRLDDVRELAAAADFRLDGTLVARDHAHRVVLVREAHAILLRAETLESDPDAHRSAGG